MCLKMPVKRISQGRPIANFDRDNDNDAGHIDRRSFIQSQSPVKSLQSHEGRVYWVVGVVLWMLSFAGSVAVASFRRVRHVRRLVELAVRRCRVSVDCAPLVGAVVVFAVVVASLAAVYSVGLYSWHKLTTHVAA